MVLISIAVYGILPTRLPIHFTLTGTVDGTAPKLEGISFMPVMELILWLISSFGIKDINLKKSNRWYRNNIISSTVSNNRCSFETYSKY
ncbi:DUF1648 domain-containing protein [Ligilactobacillus salivarius]|uniref:DUF1648 domain-containing protein n=1 Tax=Ligilactobacillus salivarius TaxID=1624 RepID=UPI001CDB4766|nr:DUF1648 domain-containing protein [Ligilactobacillus salivarius]